MGEPIFKGKGYEWFYNDSTGLGEIQVQPGVLCDAQVSIALQGEDAVAFNGAEPANHGPMIQHHWKILQAKRANRSR